jgi:hypothetical protein
LALPLFAVTLFVSAFLLFLVQPMIGKMILPRLGGTPQVWNTCMLFFQTVLLAGYAYTHTISTRLKVHTQLIVHSVLLFIPLLFLLPQPFNIASWVPDPMASAVLQALAELAILVGVPFFVVSTSAPLLQKWFVNTGHPAARDPYFLYGASNLGSLLSLLFYPFMLEPWLTLHTQAWTWLVGYFALVGLILVCVAMVWKSPLTSQLAIADMPPELPIPPIEEPAAPPPQPQPQPQAATAVRSGPAPGGGRGITRKKGLKAHGRAVHAPAPEPARAPAAIISQPSDAPVTTFRRIRWVLLAAVPSSLMLGVTSYISTDLSPFPLIWIVPLALYLLSFILVYMRWPIPWTASLETEAWTPHSLVLYFGQPLSILLLCLILLSGGFSLMYMWVAWGAFFFTALACHGELARDRPNTRHLTEYFLWISVGGALGGFFNAIVAPMMFAGVYEFYITLVLACFVRPVLLQTNWFDNFLMNAFPGLQTWARDQSDQLSRSMGKPADGSTYVLSYTLDILLGLFMFGVAWFMRAQATWGLYTPDRAARMLVFLGMDARTVNVYGYWRQAYFAVIYGIPMIFCFFFATRPIRFGLAVTALLTYNLLILGGREDRTLFQGRTYFGVLRVLEGEEELVDRKGQPKDPEEFKNFALPREKGRKEQLVYRFTYLMHGTTYHGRNYIYNPEEDNVDLSRLATTYYHRYGPAGVVMERFNWFPGPQNTYWADARMPATMVGHIMSTLGTAALPYANLVNVYSEPPYATIGLGTGTMASYGRPYQHVVYYEIDEQIRNFSLPPSGRAYFTYLQGAMKRGANLEVIMGDARLSLQNQDPRYALFPYFPTDFRLGTKEGDSENPLLMPSTIGKMTVQDPATGQPMEKSPRERYYKVIVVDAFSSDAIPVHLITLEAIDLYLHRMAPDGVLCVHTSNRHLDLVKPVAKIVEVLNKEYQTEAYKNSPLYKQHVKCKVGKDNPLPPEGGAGEDRSRFLGQFSSEYVMIFHDEKYLKPDVDYTKGMEHPEWSIFVNRSNVVWSVPREMSPAPWTDDYSNLVSILR